MGSSAVPVKRNPIKSERVSSLAKMLRSLVSVSMENIALWHERDLSNSANERFTIPMAAILLDEMLNAITKVISELKVNRDKIASNIEITKGQVFSEFVLEALVKKGVARFEAYRDIQRVVALPGERWREQNGFVYVNGTRLDEPYVEPDRRDTETIPERPVPKDEYVLPGDNRSSSCDSRRWGTVPRDDLIGPVYAVYWPPGRIGFK